MAVGLGGVALSKPDPLAAVLRVLANAAPGFGPLPAKSFGLSQYVVCGQQQQLSPQAKTTNLK